MTPGTGAGAKRRASAPAIPQGQAGGGGNRDGGVGPGRKRVAVPMGQVPATAKRTEWMGGADFGRKGA